MKAEVYSWRVSGELKAHLEREARLRKVPASVILDTAVRAWLKTNHADTGDDEVQRILHAEAESWLGAIAGRNPHRAETARETVRRRLTRRRAR